MSDLLQQVAAGVRRDGVFDGVARLLVGCSGGGDSVALLDLTARLADELELEVAVAHLHHGWRGAEADAHLELAENLARDLGLEFFARRVDLREAAGSREEAARDARLRFFAAVGADWNADAVALGHTADDQVETVFLHLARGAGRRGLGGMRPRTRIGGLLVVRPLLDVRRADLRAYLRARGRGWGEDSTNADISLARNRLRRRALADLRQINPAAVDNVARAARLLREDEEWLDELADAAIERMRAQEPHPGAMALAVADLDALPRPLRRRVVRRVVESVRRDHRELAFEHVEWVVAGDGDGARDLPGVRVRKEAGRVRFLPLSGRRLAHPETG